MFQHIRHYVRQIFLCDQFFLITQLDNAFRHHPHCILIQLQPEIFKILANVRLTACLPQRIFTFPSEPFGKQVVAIKIILIISVGVYPCHLCKDVLSHNRFIGRYHDSRIGFNHPADIIQTTLVYIGHSIKMIFQDCLHTCERGISRTLAQSVYRCVQPFNAAQHCCQYIAYRQIIVIVRMEIEMGLRITFFHLPHIFYHLQRIQDTQCIRQHKTLDTRIFQSIHQLEYVFGRILYAVTPVFQIDIDGYILLVSIAHHIDDLRQMFLRSFM